MGMSCFEKGTPAAFPPRAKTSLRRANPGFGGKTRRLPSLLIDGVPFEFALATPCRIGLRGR